MKLGRTGNFGKFYALFWGLAIIIASGCASQPGHGGAAAATVSDRGARTSDRPDYATKLAEWVVAHQAEDVARDRWGEFAEVAAGVSGAWEFFAAGNPQLASAASGDPLNLSVTQDPSLIDNQRNAALLPEVRAFLAGLERTTLLDRLDKVAEPSRFVALRAVDPLVSTSMPELGRARLCAKICVARMRIATIDGRPEQMLRSLRHALGLARGAEGRGMLLGALLANAIWASAERELRLEILEERLSAPTCAAALDVLEHTPFPSVQISLGGERFQALESIELYFEQETHEASAAGKESPTGATLPVVSRDEQLALAGRLFEGIDGLFSTDAAGRERARASIAAVESLWRSPADLARYVPVRTVMPAVLTAMQTERRTRLMHEGTRLMLALERHRARTGRYPATLMELVPQELAEVPLDPLDPDAPRPFVYRLTEPTPTDAARSYLLYSVGADGFDDGGRSPAAAGFNALSSGARARGFDFVINARDP